MRSTNCSHRRPACWRLLFLALSTLCVAGGAATRASDTLRPDAPHLSRPGGDSARSQPGGNGQRQGPYLVAEAEPSAPDLSETLVAPRREMAREITDSERAAMPGGQAPQLYELYPQAGTLSQDLLLRAFTDVASGRDFRCGDRSASGQRGVDSLIRSFREQDIGVPVFAVLDGVVVAAHDGAFDANTRDSLAGDPGPPSNYVVLDHGAGHRTAYAHLKNGSVTVREGDAVAAGMQIGATGSSGASDWPRLHFESWIDGVPYEPFAGPCREGRSGWVNQPAVETRPSAFDFAFGPQPFDSRLLPHDDAQRTGSYVVGSQPIHFRIGLANVPPESLDRLQILRPDGSLAVDEGGRFDNDTAYHAAYWDWSWRLDLDAVGTWHLLYEVNGALRIDAPFDVVGSRALVVNRAPQAVSLALESSAHVVVARVQTAPLHRDADYDVVQYRYEWRVDGVVVRDVTSAALSDVIPRPERGVVSVTVTPSDGKASGPSATAASEEHASAAEAATSEESGAGDERSSASGAPALLPGSCALGPIAVIPPGLLTDNRAITGTFKVTAPLGCNWLVPQSFIGWALVTWVDVLTGTVTYSISSNDTGAPRTHRIDVLVPGGGGEAGGSTWVPSGAGFVIEQDYRGGNGCTYTVAPAERNHTAAGGNGEFTVTASLQTCAWTAAAATGNPPGLTITAGGSGTGNGVVKYSVENNPTTKARTYQLVIAGTTVKIVVAGSPTWTAGGTAQDLATLRVLQGVTLAFTDLGGGAAPAAVTTDANGAWQQSGFRAGHRYKVTASRDGYAIVENDKVIDENGTRASFVARRLFCVSGTVQAVGGGAPPAGAVVEVMKPPSLNPIATAAVDQHGQFSSCRLEEGVGYAARPILAGWQFDPGTTAFVDDRASLLFTMYRVFRPRGTVRDRTGQSVAGVTMTFEVLSGGGAVPPAVTSTAEGWIGQTNLFDTRKRFRVTPSLARHTFTPAWLEFGDDGKPLDFVAAPEKFSVSGEVVEATTNAPVDGVTITFSRAVGNGVTPAAVRSAADGKWSQGGFEHGTTYLVGASKEGWVFDAVNPVNGSTSLRVSGYRPFAVTGTVRDSRGQPLAGVTIVFEPEVAGRPAPAAVQTAANGTYRQTGFDPRLEYRVTASLPPQEFGPGCQASAVTPRCDFSAGYAVSGRIGNGAGANFNPLAGVTVRFTISSGTGSVPEPVQTGADGRWQASGFTRNAQYVATPELPGHLFAPPNRPFNAPNNQLDFTFAPPFSVSGRVVDRERPDPGTTDVPGVVNVTIEIRNAGGTLVGRAVTGEGGNWTVNGLTRAGTYTAVPVSDQFAFRPPSRSFVAPGTGDVGQVNFVGTGPYPVTVTVRQEERGAGVGGVTLTFTDPSGREVSTGQTGDTGALTTNSIFKHLVRYAVTASAPPIAGGPPRVFKPASIHFSGPSRNLVFTEVPPYTVSGTITREGSREIVVPGVTVTFTPAGGGAAKTAVSDARGNYKCEGLAPDTEYSISASLEGWTFRRVAPVRNSATRNIVGEPSR